MQKHNFLLILAQFLLIWGEGGGVGGAGAVSAGSLWKGGLKSREWFKFKKALRGVGVILLQFLDAV